MQRLSGLTAQEADKRLRQYGPNSLNERSAKSPAVLLFNQIRKNYLIYMLAIASALSFFVGKTVTAWAILAVIIMVVSTTFIQEYRAERAVAALKNMILPATIVIRGGKERKIDSSLVVPGDIVVLHSGERVPADGRIISANELRVNEAALTGESKEVAKSVSDDAHSTHAKVFMGTFVVNGKATIEVAHTGMNTEFGKIAEMISAAEKELPLQTKINKIVRYMSTVAILSGLLVGIISLLRNTPITSEVIGETIIIVIAIMVSAFPEGFPVVLTSTLATGAFRMAKKNAVVNRMSTIETLGETTVICSDKTGTITVGEMTAKKIVTFGKECKVEGIGYSAEGAILFRDQPVEMANHPDLSLLLKSAVLCNDTRISREEADEDYTVTGSPTEAALLFLAAKAGLHQDDFQAERLKEIPFNSERKFMAVLCKEETGFAIYAKGAPEVIISRSSKVFNGDETVNLTETDKEKLLSKVQALARGGYRTIALAYRQTDEDTIKSNEKHLVFLGILGIDDPPRPEIKESIETARRAGITVKMITGDNKDTARAIARQVGLYGKALTGAELDEMTDEELGDVVSEIDIFARVKPGDKLRIVNVLKKKGEVVTMTGDGVNDAPALKEAHIGVAMGINGTDVTREVADLTLKDDNFATIVEAIREGRSIFENIRKFVTYQLSCNIAEIILVVVATIVGLPLPLVALQILFMNLVTDDLPAISLGFTPPSKDIMRLKPRKRSNILTKQLVSMILILGAFMGGISLLVFYTSYGLLNLELDVARTATLLTMIFFEITGAFCFRSLKLKASEMPFFSNIYLIWATVISILATVIVIYTPLNAVFNAKPINPLWWLVFLVISLPLSLVIDYIKAKKDKVLRAPLNIVKQNI